MVKNSLDASETIVKSSYASVTIVIDVPCNQDDPNNKNRQNSAIQCNSGQSVRLDNEKIGITRIGLVKQLK